MIQDDSALSESYNSSGSSHSSFENEQLETNDSGFTYADLILPTDDLIEELPLPSQEEFDLEVKERALTSTDPAENLEHRLNKIMTPTKSLSITI